MPGGQRGRSTSSMRTSHWPPGAGVQPVGQRRHQRPACSGRKGDGAKQTAKAMPFRSRAGVLLNQRAA